MQLQIPLPAFPQEAPLQPAGFTRLRRHHSDGFYCRPSEQDRASRSAARLSAETQSGLVLHAVNILHVLTDHLPGAASSSSHGLSVSARW